MVNHCWKHGYAIGHITRHSIYLVHFLLSVYLPFRLGPFFPDPAETPFFDLAPSWAARCPRSRSKVPVLERVAFGGFLDFDFVFTDRRSGTPILLGRADFLADRIDASTARLSPISASSSIANFRLFAFLDSPENLFLFGWENRDVSFFSSCKSAQSAPYLVRVSIVGHFLALGFISTLESLLVLRLADGCNQKCQEGII